MTQIKLAVFWSVALLASAFAARFELFAPGMAEGLFYGLLMGAGVSITLCARQASC